MNRGKAWVRRVGIAGCALAIPWITAVTGAGCTFGGSDLYADKSQAVGADGGADGGSEATAGGDGQTSSLPDVSGSWAQRWVVGSIDTMPVIGDVQASTKSLMRVQVEQRGADLLMRVETCLVEVDSGTEIIQEVIPDAFVASLGISVRAVWLERQGSRYRFVQPRAYELRGVRLLDVAGEALPTSAQDPRVYDQDVDGRPGVTVRVTGLVDGEVWVAQRDSHEVEGEVVSLDRIEGRIRWLKEQAILGADNPLLESPLPSVPDPNPDRSTMVMVRTSEDMQCAGIVAQEAELFGEQGGGG